MANSAQPADLVAQAFDDSDDSLPEDAADPAEVAHFDAPSADILPEDIVADDVDQADLDDLAALDGAAPIIDDAAYLEPEAAEADADLIEAVDQPAAELPTEPKPEIAVSPEAPVVAEKIQRARARVIKIRRLDKKASDAAPAIALTPEAEADLQNTLAALEAEISPEAQLDADFAASEPTSPTAEDLAHAVEKAKENKLAVADDAAVDRLLARTNRQLEVPETKRRRSAIAHLKAAVLATVADRRNNPKAQADVAEVKMDPYRQDLNQAVRPVGAPLGNDRPAPLVLVSAQRIDRKRDAVADANRPVPQIVASSTPAPQAAPVNPVRPRRVSSGGLAQAVSSEMAEYEDSDVVAEANDTVFAGSAKQSFAEFAESLGATTIAEQIEAAGAYCTLVLDRPNFTRPLLFQQIATLSEDAELNREESLRGFGKLLRDGRIQKSVRGQFALSETSPILTEAKRIAG